MRRTPLQRARRLLGVLVRVAVLPLALAGGLWLGGHPSKLPGFVRDAFVEHSEADTLGRVLDLVHDDYYRTIPRGALFDRSVAGLVASLHDRFSAYYDKREYKRVKAGGQESFDGVGMTVAQDPLGLKILKVYPGTPARRAGLRPGDRIVAAGGHSLKRRPDAYSTALIRGKPGTFVVLRVLRAGRTTTKRVVRAQIDLPAVESELVRANGKSYAHIAVAGFSSGVHGDVAEAVKRLRGRGASGVVLDLRGNGGGLLQEAVLMSSIFVPDGTIVSTRARAAGRKTYSATGGAIPTSVPVAVLVDRNSASASEIVAGAIQDRHRGKVVGTRTFGKGVFQELEGLPNGGALQITVGEYFTPSGRNLGGGGIKRGAGITPDIKAQDNPRTRRDEALDAAVKALAPTRR